jgi:hypothetical protein
MCPFIFPIYFFTKKLNHVPPKCHANLHKKCCPINNSRKTVKITKIFRCIILLLAGWEPNNKKFPKKIVNSLLLFCAPNDSFNFLVLCFFNPIKWHIIYKNKRLFTILISSSLFRLIQHFYQPDE